MSVFDASCMRDRLLTMTSSWEGSRRLRFCVTLVRMAGCLDSSYALKIGRFSLLQQTAWRIVLSLTCKEKVKYGKDLILLFLVGETL